MQWSLTDSITHIIIEDTNRRMIQIAKGKKLVIKVNLVGTQNKRYGPSNKNNKNNKKSDYKPKSSNPKFKKKGNFFVCGKTRHHEVNLERVLEDLKRIITNLLSQM